MLRKVLRSFLASVAMLICYLIFFVAFVFTTARATLTGRTFQLGLIWKTYSEALTVLELDIADYINTGKLGDRTKID